MVQTIEQYTFIYLALMESTLFGNTEIELSDLTQWLADLNQIMPGGVTGLTHEVSKIIVNAQHFYLIFI